MAIRAFSFGRRTSIERLGILFPHLFSKSPIANFQIKRLWYKHNNFKPFGTNNKRSAVCQADKMTISRDFRKNRKNDHFLQSLTLKKVGSLQQKLPTSTPGRMCRKIIENTEGNVKTVDSLRRCKWTNSASKSAPKTKKPTSGPVGGEFSKWSTIFWISRNLLSTSK